MFRHDKCKNGFCNSQIALLRGENATAKTLQSAVKSLERDKAQLQSRVNNLEQKLEGGNGDVITSGLRYSSILQNKTFVLETASLGHRKPS